MKRLRRQLARIHKHSHPAFEHGGNEIMRRALLILAIAALGLRANDGARAQSGGTTGTPADATSEGVGSATVLAVHGKIVDVDKARKLVTLEGPRGQRVTLEIQNPYNLEAARVGAKVVAHFYEIVTIRKKKPGESGPSASLKEGIATATTGEVPGAGAGIKLKLVVSVVEIDKANGTVTIKGPDGTVEKVRARNPRNLERIKVGDDLVVGVSRGVAISLEQESGS